MYRTAGHAGEDASPVPIDGATTIGLRPDGDTIDGGDGEGLLVSDTGADTLRGGDGPDTLEGDAGADRLAGEGGLRDECDGGAGSNDALIGGSATSRGDLT